MKHRVKNTSKLGRKPDHRQLLLRNLATSLVLHEKIITSVAKAKALQPMVERVIRNTKKKPTDIEAIRYLKATLLEEKAQRKMLREIKAKYENRASGFTRITPLKISKGDATLKVQIELV